MIGLTHLLIIMVGYNTEVANMLKWQGNDSSRKEKYD